MTELPEDLMREAREVAREFYDLRVGNGIRLSKAIARALRARDERAARIARRKIVGGYMHGAPEWPDGEAIASAILSDKEQSHAE